MYTQGSYTFLQLIFQASHLISLPIIDILRVGIQNCEFNKRRQDVWVCSVYARPVGAKVNTAAQLFLLKTLQIDAFYRTQCANVAKA